MKLFPSILVFISATLLTACGGGGGLSAGLGSLVGSVERIIATQEQIAAPGINVAPTTQAGADKEVLTGSKVTLDGSKSTDANSDTLTYQWTLTRLPQGSNATLVSNTDAISYFVADLPGIYVATLTVSDGKLSGGAIPVTVTANIANAKPVANAGVFQNVLITSKVTLDGSKSTDANNDRLTYEWTLRKPSGSTAILVSDTDAKPSFIADLTGSYFATLTVFDGKEKSTPVEVKVTAVVDNAPPTANAGTAQYVVTDSKVTLNGSKSLDPNSDPLTYKWTMYSKPTGSTATLVSDTDAMPSFTADLPGTYTISLIVNDGIIHSLTDVVAVIVTTANAAPVANAGSTQNVLIGASVVLDGSASSDANRDALTYNWVLFSKPPTSSASLLLITSARPTFVADLAGTYVASLVVNDGQVNSALVTVAVTAAAANVVPIANAGINQTVINSSMVTLDGSASSDANRDFLTYKWTLLSKPANSSAALSSVTAAKPTFTADLPGTYVASLIVNDGLVNSTAASVAVTSNATPVAISGADQTVKVAALVTLDGSKSTDANNDALSYKWVLVSKPANSNAVLSSTTDPKPTFTPDLPGDYAATFMVNDGLVDSATVAVKVTATSN